MPEETLETPLEVITPDPEPSGEQVVEIPAEPSEKAAAPEDKLEIEVVDDTPPEDRRPPRNEAVAAALGPPDEIPEDELKAYSEHAKKRFKRLTYEFHEQRRGKEEAQRQLEELARFAAAQRSQADEMRKVLAANHAVTKTSMVERTNAELISAREAVRKAHELGDVDKIVEAQERLSNVVAEQRSIAAVPEFKADSIQLPEVPNLRPAPPKPSDKASAWAKRNPWFDPSMNGGNPEMTVTAVRRHRELVDAGVDVNSDEYFDEIDKEVRKRYSDLLPPERNVSQPARPPVRTQQAVKSPVAAVTRAANGTHRVTLTKSQLAIAERFGLTPAQYAKEVYDLEKNNA
jgi:hypothetical protein